MIAILDCIAFRSLTLNLAKPHQKKCSSLGPQLKDSHKDIIPVQQFWNNDNNHYHKSNNNPLQYLMNYEQYN